MARPGLIEMVDPAPAKDGGRTIVEMWPVDAKHAQTHGWKPLEQLLKEEAEEKATEAAAERAAAKMKSGSSK